MPIERCSARKAGSWRAASAASSRVRAKARRTTAVSSVNGAIVITPASSIPGSSRIRPMPSIARSAGKPPLVSSPAEFTSTKARTVAPAFTASAEMVSARRTESSECSRSKRGSAFATLLRCRCPIRCQRTAARPTASTLSASSCTRFSPTSATPARIAACTVEAGCVLVTATSVTAPVRPARSRARSIRSRTSATRPASPSVSMATNVSPGAGCGKPRGGAGAFTPGSSVRR